MDSKIIELFPVPLYMSQVEPISDSLVEFLTDLPNERMPNGTAKYSLEKHVLDYVQCTKLRLEIFDHFSKYLDALRMTNPFEWYITTSWVNELPPGGHGRLHSHQNSMFSGVVYLQTANSCGNIVFHKENTNQIPFTFDYKEYNNLNSTNWEVEPEDNRILIFPSSLMHSMKTNQSESMRYSLAFNFFAKGTFGSKETELIL